jgi:hypothetical protein
MRSTLTLLLLFCTVAGIQAAGQVFVVPPQYATGIGANAVAFGDFNGDGKPDLVVSNNCPASGCGGSPPSTVSILLGNGDGTFQTHVDYPVGTPAGVAVGDCKQDLAVANGNSVAVLLGNGDGTFQAAVDYGTAGGTTAVAVGDFNGDSKLDLVVTNSTNSSVSIFLNSGNGTFPTRKDYATGLDPVSVTVGDFNGDSKLDLAVVNECTNSSNCDVSPGSVSILLGNGDGTFQTHVDYGVGFLPVSVVAADLNGDGFLDLAVANSGGSGAPSPGSISVLLGNGNGTFQAQQVYVAGNGPSSVVVGDFNGDGQLDFAVTNSTDETVGVYLNQGHGIFAQPTVFYGAGGGAGPAVPADLNGDKNLDLAVLCGGVCVLLGKGNGSFSPTSLSYPSGSGPDAVAMADLNGDSKNDIAVANFNDNDVSVFIGNGDGTLQPAVNYSTGNGPSSVAIGDLRGDGKLDLVVANQAGNTVSVLLNNGNGTFQTHVDYPTATGPLSVAIGDFNEDGKLDLVVACASNVSLLLGNGDGTFQTHVDYGPSGVAVATGDFNGDGLLDFAVVGGSSLTIFLNKSGGSFSSTTIPLTGLGESASHAKAGRKPPFISTGFEAIVVADFNGDGKLDLAVSGFEGTVVIAPLEVLLGNGDGTFQSPIVASANGVSMAVGDFNGDGILDIALGDVGYVGLSLGNGDGTFRSPSSYPTGSSLFGGVVATGDLNGDNKPDLAVANGTNGSPGTGSNTLTILLNNAGTASSFKLAGSPASQTVSAGNSTTFTVTATSANGFNSSVSLTCSGEPSGSTCTVNPASVVPTVSGATATVTVTTGASAPVGIYTLAITGTSGSEQFSVRPTLTVKPEPPDFTVSAPSSLTPSSVMPGQSATATVTVDPTGGFTGTVALSCSVSPASAPAPTCSFNPAKVAVTGSGSATSTLTVSTTGPTAVLVRPSLRRGGLPIYAMVFPMIGLALVGIGFAPGFEKARQLLGFAICCLLVGGLVFLVACGSGSSSSHGSGGTPAGSYTVNITASSGSTQHTTSAMLTVQ